MPDDPNKKGQDAKRVSQQDHEQRYQKQKASKQSQGGAKQGKGRSSK